MFMSVLPFQHFIQILFHLVEDLCHLFPLLLIHDRQYLFHKILLQFFPVFDHRLCFFRADQLDFSPISYLS